MEPTGEQRLERRAFRRGLSATLAAAALLAPVGVLADPGVCKRLFAEVAVSALLAWWLLRPGVRASGPAYVPYLLAPLAAYLAWIGLSAAWASHPGAALDTFTRWLSAVIVLLLAANALYGRRELIRLFALIWGAAVILAAYAIPEHLLALDWLGRAPATPAASFGNKNMLMHYMVLSAPAGIVLLLEARSRITCWLLGLSAGAVAAVYVYAMTRAALVAAAVQAVFLIVYLLANRRALIAPGLGRHRWGALALGALTAAALGLLTPLQDAGQGRAAGTRAIEDLSYGTYHEADSARRRLLLWRRSFSLMGEHPLIGVGAGNWYTQFPAHAPELSGDRRFWPVLRAHNFYVESAADLGLVGVLILLWAGVRVARASLAALRCPEADRLAVGGALAGVLGILVNAAFSFNLELTVPLVFLAAYLGVLDRASARGRVLAAAAHQRPARRAAGLLAALLVAALLGLNWARWHEEVQFSRAQRSAAAGDWRAMRARAEAARKAYPLASRPLAYLAYAELRLQSPERAIDYAQALLKREPANYAGLSMLMHALAQTGRTRQAIEVALRALRMRPQDADMLRNLAVLSAREGDEAGAKRALEQARGLAGGQRERR